jgi:hypothetical protein
METSNLPGTHDPLGLFWYASWLGGHGFFVSLLLCLALAPLAMVVIAPVFETRFLPLGKKQFDGFFPGTVFLAIGTAILLSIASDFDHDPHWYNSTWWHLIVQLGTLIGAVVMTIGDRKVYPKRALYSPTKVFNNLLYAFYGYVIVTTFVTELVGGGWSFWTGVKEAVAWLCIALWVVRVRRDGKLRKTDPDAFNAKVAAAHIPDWAPIWSAIGEVRRDRNGGAHS